MPRRAVDSILFDNDVAGRPSAANQAAGNRYYQSQKDRTQPSVALIFSSSRKNPQVRIPEKTRTATLSKDSLSQAQHSEREGYHDTRHPPQRSIAASSVSSRTPIERNSDYGLYAERTQSIASNASPKRRQRQYASSQASTIGKEPHPDEMYARRPIRKSQAPQHQGDLAPSSVYHNQKRSEQTVSTLTPPTRSPEESGDRRVRYDACGASRDSRDHSNDLYASRPSRSRRSASKRSSNRGSVTTATSYPYFTYYDETSGGTTQTSAVNENNNNRSSYSALARKKYQGSDYHPDRQYDHSKSSKTPPPDERMNPIAHEAQSVESFYGSTSSKKLYAELNACHRAAKLDRQRNTDKGKMGDTRALWDDKEKPSFDPPSRRGICTGYENANSAGVTGVFQEVPPVQCNNVAASVIRRVTSNNKRMVDAVAPNKNLVTNEAWTAAVHDAKGEAERNRRRNAN